MELCCFQESEKTAFEIAPLSPEQKELVEALQLRFVINFNIYCTFFDQNHCVYAGTPTATCTR